MKFCNEIMFNCIFGYSINVIKVSGSMIIKLRILMKVVFWKMLI